MLNDGWPSVYRLLFRKTLNCGQEVQMFYLVTHLSVPNSFPHRQTLWWTLRCQAHCLFSCSICKFANINVFKATTLRRHVIQASWDPVASWLPYQKQRKQGERGRKKEDREGNLSSRPSSCHPHWLWRLSLAWTPLVSSCGGHQSTS
jgi:hypothetical protein